MHSHTYTCLPQTHSFRLTLRNRYIHKGTQRHTQTHSGTHSQGHNLQGDQQHPPPREPCTTRCRASAVVQSRPEPEQDNHQVAVYPQVQVTLLPPHPQTSGAHVFLFHRFPEWPPEPRRLRSAGGGARAVARSSREALRAGPGQDLRGSGEQRCKPGPEWREKRNYSAGQGRAAPRRGTGRWPCTGAGTEPGAPGTRTRSAAQIPPCPRSRDSGGSDDPRGDRYPRPASPPQVAPESSCRARGSHSAGRRPSRDPRRHGGLHPATRCPRVLPAPPPRLTLPASRSSRPTPAARHPPGPRGAALRAPGRARRRQRSRLLRGPGASAWSLDPPRALLRATPIRAAGAAGGFKVEKRRAKREGGASWLRPRPRPSTRPPPSTPKTTPPPRPLGRTAAESRARAPASVRSAAAASASPPWRPSWPGAARPALRSPWRRGWERPQGSSARPWVAAEGHLFPATSAARPLRSSHRLPRYPLLFQSLRTARHRGPGHLGIGSVRAAPGLGQAVCPGCLLSE